MDFGSLDISCYRQIAFTCAQDRMMQRRVSLGKESDALACHSPYQCQALTSRVWDSTPMKPSGFLNTLSFSQGMRIPLNSATDSVFSRKVVVKKRNHWSVNFGISSRIRPEYAHGILTIDNYSVGSMANDSQVSD